MKLFEIEPIIASSRELDANGLLALLRADRNIFWSWGASDFMVFSKRVFKMRVRGHHHKGYVYIACNGLDLFDVYLVSTHGNLVGEMNNLYFDQLVECIDEKIEKIAAYKS